MLAISLLAVTVSVFQIQDIKFPVVATISSTSIKDEELVKFLDQYGDAPLDSLPPIDAISIAEVSAVLDHASKVSVSSQSKPSRTYIPALLKIYPLPEGYKFSIFQHIDSINLDRLTATTANLVNNYSPRITVQTRFLIIVENARKILKNSVNPISPDHLRTCNLN